MRNERATSGRQGGRGNGRKGEQGWKERMKEREESRVIEKKYSRYTMQGVSVSLYHCIALCCATLCCTMTGMLWLMSMAW